MPVAAMTLAMSSANWSAENAGASISDARRGSAAASPAAIRNVDHSPSALPARAYSNAARAYGRATVDSSAIELRAADLGGQLVEQRRVGLGVHFALQELRRAPHG